MKYTIEGFSQSEAIKFKDIVDGKTIQIDVTDLSILRWLVDFYPRMPKTEINGSQYVWISYKALLNDMPLLDIKKVALANRLKKMVHFGILNFELVQNGNTYTYYSFGNNYMNLIRTPVSQMTTPCQSNDNPPVSQMTTPCQSNDNHNNSSINNSSINDKSINSVAETKEAKTSNNASSDAVFDFSGFSDNEVIGIKEWLQYKQERKESYKLQSGLTKLRNILLDLKSKGQLIHAVDRSITNGWKGLFEDKNFVQPEDADDDNHIDIDSEPIPKDMNEDTWELFKQWWKESRKVHKLSYSRRAFNKQINTLHLNIDLLCNDQYKIVMYSMNPNKGIPYQNIILEDKYKQKVAEIEEMINFFTPKHLGGQM